MDRYFVPSEFTRRGILLRGVAPELIEVTGILVSLETADPKEPAAMRERYGLPSTGR